MKKLEQILLNMKGWTLDGKTVYVMDANMKSAGSGSGKTLSIGDKPVSVPPPKINMPYKKRR